MWPLALIGMIQMADQYKRAEWSIIMLYSYGSVLIDNSSLEGLGWLKKSSSYYYGFRSIHSW